MAATNDILTLAEARLAVRIPTGQTSELEAMITGLSTMVDDLCGPVVTRAVTEVVSGPYSGPILLMSTPVVSITSVVEHVGTTNTTLAADTYQLDADGHLARLFARSAGYDITWTSGARNYTVTLSSGRYANTAAVGYSWKERFRSLLAAKWQFESATWQRNRDDFPVDELGGVSTFNAEARIRELFASDLLPPGMA